MKTLRPGAVYCPRSAGETRLLMRPLPAARHSALEHQGLGPVQDPVIESSALLFRHRPQTPALGQVVGRRVGDVWESVFIRPRVQTGWTRPQGESRTCKSMPPQ